jgi:GH25 family lysozyme M1 (1,4-beta-N-acetylmuramidase)
MSLNGIDIASYQSGMDCSKVDADFIIIKTSQGKNYVNPTWRLQAQQTVSSGKLLGLYHYIDGSGVDGEAEHFVRQCADYVGKALICVDWESGSNSKYGNDAYLISLVRTIEDKLGVGVTIYCGQYDMKRISKTLTGHNWWIAQYAYNSGTGHPSGYQDKPWNEGAYSCLIRQYTSDGHIKGYNESYTTKGIDLNKFYGDRAAWETACKSKAATVPKNSSAPSNTESIIVPRLDLEVQCLNRGRSGKKIGGGEICMFDDAIVGLSIGATLGGIKYRVHRLGGGWLSQITKCDWATPDAYAGDLKNQIDGVQIYFKTDISKTAGKYYRAKYQVKTARRGWLGEIYDTNWESGDGDHTAGVFGDPIIGIRAEAVPC